MSAIRTVETVKNENNEVITTLKIDDHDVYVYRPVDTMMSDIINYAYSAPLLLVFADKKLTTDEAITYAKKQNWKRSLRKTAEVSSSQIQRPAGMKKRLDCMKRSSTRPKLNNGASQMESFMTTRFHVHHLKKRR